MKLLVINGNMTQAITDVCANAAREVASPGTEVVSASGTFGPQVIGSRSENALAQHGMLELAAKHAPGCDAVVIAVSSTPSAWAVTLTGKASSITLAALPSVPACTEMVSASTKLAMMELAMFCTAVSTPSPKPVMLLSVPPVTEVSVV